MRTLTVLLAILAMAACTNQHLGPAKGPPFALNAGQWMPTLTDLDVKADE